MLGETKKQYVLMAAIEAGKKQKKNEHLIFIPVATVDIIATASANQALKEKDDQQSSTARRK
ncbi:MAG: hypothetical protein V7K33_11595 [Nostoc sp.]